MSVAATIDNAIMAIAPQWGARRAKARLHAMAYSRAYEAAEPSRLRRSARDYGSGNAAVMNSAVGLRTQARHLERNHDIVRGAINALVTNTIGQAGIGVEPQPRNAAGDIDEGLVDQINRLRRDWCKRPEVTWSHDWASAERILARSWFRDGEALLQELIGAVPFLDHGTQVPYSLELLEADLLPHDYNDDARNIMQGVECNTWGRAIGYHVYKRHPGDPNVYADSTKRVSADRIRHLKMIDRMGQRRGVSLLASVLTRLDDLKDYEESERIAAKIAASLAAVIIKGDPQSYGESTDPNAAKTGPRRMQMQPGMIFDDLRPGESVETIDSKRPNPNLEVYRNGQLRATAAGMSVSFSTLAKNYNGSYSAQRQELVEQYGAYGVLSHEFINQISRPTYERLIFTAVASGELVVPRGTPMASLADALYLAPTMPWIDPQREANSMQILEDNCYMSGPEIIRRRGANPRDVLDQQSAWLQRKKDWQIPARQGSAADNVAPAAATEDTQ